MRRGAWFLAVVAILVSLSSAGGSARATHSGIVATFDVVGERFRVLIKNQQTIEQVRALQRGESTATIPNGRLLRGSDGNEPWSWHLDPYDIELSEIAIELCDGRPSFVEQDLDYWVDTVGTFCPWSAELVNVEEVDGRIKGTLFYDMDGDGMRDDGDAGLREPGRLRSVALIQDENIVRRVYAEHGGAYDISDVPPGSYTLAAELDGGAGICADSAFSFNPVVTSFCINYTLPWNATTPASVPIVVEPGSNVVVDFGAQPADVAVVAGVVLLEDGWAPAGTPLTALVNGKECGSTAVQADAELNYLITIPGAGEREGCAAPGDAVIFRVGEVMAAETYQYEPFAAGGLLSRLQRANLTAIKDYAWYWFELFPERRPQPGLIVEAFVGEQPCGSTELESPYTQIAGFSRLIVPSGDLAPGCGANGALVEFRVGGLRAETVVPWHPGLQRLDLLVQGDADCDFAVGSLDAALVLQHAARLVASLPCHGDADRDGDTDAFDARHILEFTAGITNALPL